MWALKLTWLSTGWAFRGRFGLRPLLLLVVLLFLRLWALLWKNIYISHQDLCRLGRVEWKMQVNKKWLKRTDRSRARSLSVVLLWLLWVLLCLGVVMLAFMLLSKETHDKWSIIRFIKIVAFTYFNSRLTSKTCMKSLNILFLSDSSVTSSNADSLRNLSLTWNWESKSSIMIKLFKKSL